MRDAQSNSNEGIEEYNILHFMIEKYLLNMKNSN